MPPQDRRWRNMVYAAEQLKAEGKAPQTWQDELDFMTRYGYQACHPLTAAQKARRLDSQWHLGEFSAACGGFSTPQDYPAKGEPEAPTKCDCCKKQGEAQCHCWQPFWCMAQMNPARQVTHTWSMHRLGYSTCPHDRNLCRNGDIAVNSTRG